MPSYDPDQLGQLADSAPEAGFAPINYGKLTVDAKVLTWKRTEGEPSTPVRTDLKKGQVLARGETLELTFTVDIAEFNPALQFEYARSVSVQKSSARQKTDWTEIVEPSLIATFGKDWPKAISTKPYVEVEDAVNINGKLSKSGKAFGVPKFLKKYANAAACQKAREERFGTAAAPATDATPGIPPDAVVTQTVNLIKGIGAAAARPMLDNHPFGNFDPDVLFAMAQAKG